MKNGTWSGLLALCCTLAATAPLAAQTAPGGPGALPTWTNAAKDGIGTSLTTASKVWYTLEGGILTEVYYPRVDQADVHGLEFAVSNGKQTWFEAHDMQHSIQRVDDRALIYRQTSRVAAAGITITKTYTTDPQRNTLLIDVTYTAPPGDKLYVIYQPALENVGYGNFGATQDGALVSWKKDMASALVSSGGFGATSNGFAGVNDAYTDLMLHH
ncbi:MAG: glucoamylase, partial [Gemmatimonadota bacterium]|nr:glucoamylase [Gemmatimonadota bacterium]